jgi:uncharacterized repeat protein (TIGR01451 family)/fimbrial isopeptide formation D2 family protein
MALVPVVGGTVAPSVGASPPPNLTLSESAPQTVLYGTDASVALTASLSSSDPLWGYNLSYEDVLPAGVSYVSGSTSPASVGDPQILANQPATHNTTLIWSNVSDLSPGSSNTLSFSLAAATDADPTPRFLPNENYRDTTSAYVNTGAREVPQFTPGGTPSNYTDSATTSGTTVLSPLEVTQSPSGAELRGVHDHHFVSTITVTNNDVHATDGITVDDWLPAGLEYLLCGQTDNTTDAPTNLGSVEEYPGSGPISGHLSLSSPSPCLTPTTVATVDTDPDGNPEMPTAVYTHVEWTDVASLAPSATLILEFVTAIPIRANTMTWTSGSAPITALGQAANLDNNSGAETVDGTSLPIYATASGTYMGNLGGSGANPVEATGYDTIVARDIVTTKIVSPGTFWQNHDVTYTITVSTSEYRYSEDITVTDTLPSGLCPLGNKNYDIPQASACDPIVGGTPSPPSPAYDSVTANNSDGTFTLVWDLGEMAPSTTDTITFPAADRTAYQAGGADTTPTVGNDTLTNTETASGNLWVRCDRDDPTCTGSDSPISHDGTFPAPASATATASQAAPGSTITVEISQNVPAGQPMTCASATYLSTTSAGYPPTYQKGDLICFKIDVSYPLGTDFKNPTVTDFIPPNTSFVSESTTTASSASNVGFTQASGELQWTMGNELSDSNLYEAPGTLFETEFSVVATADPTVGNTFNLTQDLAKLVTSNTVGTTFTVRDLVTYQLAAPIVTLAKAVSTIGGNPAPQPKNDTVRGADLVGYTLTVKDTGIVDAYDVEVWDVLPAQENCSEVSDIVPYSAACASGIIEWQPSAIPDLGPGVSTQLTFTLEIRPDAGAGETFANTAGVRTFVGEHNDSGQSNNLYYPQHNIDSSVTSVEENATRADDSADVITAGATVTKSAVTSITTPYNNNAETTIGETIAYTVAVTVPHNTTFYTASLADPLGAQQTYVADSGVVTLPDQTSFNEGSSSESFSYAYASGTNTVTLTFPTPYPNLTSADEVVTVQFSVLVADVVANTRNAQISNVATLTDHSSVGGLITAANTPVDTLIVEPDVTMNKTVSPAKIQPGGTNSFTITVANPAGTGVSSAYNLVGTDTIPTTPTPGLSYVGSYGVVLSGPEGGTASESGGVISWSIPELDPGQTDTIAYEVNPPASDDMTNGETTDAGGWTNTATLTSWCGVNDCASVPGTRTYGPLSADVPLPAEFPSLQATKSAPDGSTALDDTAFSWKVVIKNAATVAIANSLAVTDTLPPNWLYDTGSAEVTPPSGSATQIEPSSIAVNAGGDVLSWVNLGILNPGQSLTIVYTATPDVSPLTTSNTGPSYAYPNQAYATATDNTDSPGNGSVAQYTSNTSTVDAYIGDAVLQITKTHSGDFSAGADGTYTLTVTNQGPSTAGAPVIVSDTMVSPESFVSASGSNTTSEWKCTFTSPTVTCTLDTPSGSGATTLASGVTAPPLSVVVDTPSSTANGTQVTNTAGVSSPTWDPDAPSTASDPTAIEANADLQITKSHTGSFTAGSQGTYTISIYNNGPSDAVGPLTVTDTLPGAETLVSYSETGWTCYPPSGGVFTCTTPSGLASGSFAAPLEITVAVASWQAPGVITNRASVSSPTQNPVPGDSTSNDPTTIVTSADLALTKQNQSAFVAGDQGIYTFTVTNSEGPSDAAGPLTVTDPLPSGETFVSGGGGSTGWSCSVSAGTVTCTDTSGLDVGDTSSFTMTVAIASDVTVSTLTNTATLSSGTTDPVPGNETGKDSAGTTQSADLQVVKTLTSSSLVAGQGASYSLAVTDNGPSDAAGPVTLTDTLPTGESYSGFSGTGWFCGASSGTVTCTHSAAITDGSETTVTLTVLLASDVLPQSIANTATVSSTTPDSGSGNNTSTATNSSTTSADLSITKSDAGPFTAGDDGEYQINVSNAGPSDAQDPVVTDTLPSGETYVGAIGGAWDCSASGHVVTCTDGTNVVAGTSAATIDLTVAISPSLSPGTVVNNATVSSPTSHPIPDNESATDRTVIDTSADLAITKTHTGSFDAGADGAYTLTVTNHGPSDAALPLTVTDPVPAPLILVSASGGSAWDCTVSSGNDVSCVALAPLPAGDTAATISVVVSTLSSQTATSVTNTASVTSATSDPDESNNSSSDPTSIVTSADLWVTKTHQGTFTAGTDGSYLIAVGNLGPSDAAEPVVVSDTLPASETFASATGTGWSCSDDLQVVTCTDAANLPSGEDAPDIDLSVAIASGATGSVTNTATVASTTSDPVTANNSGSDTAALALSSDLSITKTHTGDFTAGLDGTYTIGVHNTGPSDSGTGVVVSDTLPSGETFVSAEGTGWSCAAVDVTVTCTLGTSIVVAGDAPSLDLTVAVRSGAVGTPTNVVVVQGPNPDPMLANNTASDPTTSDRVSDLSLSKTLTGSLQDRGDATYAFAVTNAGPSDSAAPVTLTDPLPAGLAYVSSTAGTAGTWSCAVAGQTVTCTDSAPVVAGTASTFDIKVAVSAVAGTEITNTATVEAAGDVGAAAESASADGGVAAAARVPDSGASAGQAPWPLGALLLVIGGLGLVAGSRRRLWRLLRHDRTG